MSSADLAALLPTLQAIPADTLKRPTFPVKIYLQEAENLVHWCQQDQAALTAARLDWTLVSGLPQRIGALREAESQWFNNRHSRDAAQQVWDEQAPQAYALRDKLLRDMRFAYRQDAALLKRVAEITEGTGHADMIQDLNDIAALGRIHSSPLNDIGVDLTLLDKAAATADGMADLLAQVNGERADNNGARVLRDQAFTHLKWLVDEIRACGQYVFWDNAERRAGYASQYLRATRAASKSTATPATV